MSSESSDRFQQLAAFQAATAALTAGLSDSCLREVLDHACGALEREVGEISGALRGR